jgi:hypothetical protein
MAKSKKTFNVVDFVLYINEQLAGNDIDQSAKEALCRSVEHVLHKSNNYHGYQYLYWDKQGFTEWLAAGKPEGPEKDKFMYGPSMNRYDRFYYFPGVKNIFKKEYLNVGEFSK